MLYTKFMPWWKMCLPRISCKFLFMLFFALILLSIRTHCYYVFKKFKIFFYSAIERKFLQRNFFRQNHRMASWIIFWIEVSWFVLWSFIRKSFYLLIEFNNSTSFLLLVFWRNENLAPILSFFFLQFFLGDQLARKNIYVLFPKTTTLSFLWSYFKIQSYIPSH